jgi:hypothetical protein
MTMSETDHEAMVRWQGYSREQRSTVNSLFLTYAAALLGLQSSILLSKEVTMCIGHGGSSWPAAERFYRL